MLNELKSSDNLYQFNLTWLLNIWSGTTITFILFLFFVLLMIIEFNYPCRKWGIKYSKLSYKTNIKLFIFNNIIISLLAIPSLLILAEHYSDSGLLSSIKNPAWKALLSFLSLDLLLYFLHKASHSFDTLWILHRIHHNDNYLNVSTAFRIHFIEIIIINVMKALLIMALGIDLVYMLINEVIITFFTMLHHTNISFSCERLIGRVIITPYLHRAHHSTLRNEHDSNYGTVLSIWDRLFGTLNDLQPVEIGIKGYSSQDLLTLISCGLIMTGNSSNKVDNLNVMIAEAAYYKAEKRGFDPGHELRDWLEAKSEIINLIYGKEHFKNQLKQKCQIFISRLTKPHIRGNVLFRKQIN